MYPLDLVGLYDPAVEDAGLVGAAFFGHCAWPQDLLRQAGNTGITGRRR
jgi:hypothetical protein